MAWIRFNTRTLLLALLALTGMSTIGYLVYQARENSLLINPVLTEPAKVPRFFQDNGSLVWETPAPTIPSQPERANRALRLGRSRTFVTIGGISPDGRLLATFHGRMFLQDCSCPIHLWDVASGKHLHTLTGHRTAILSLAISADGSILASGGMDNVLRLWDTATGKQRGTDIKHQGHVYSLCFASTGFTLASGSNQLRLWNAEKAEQIRRFDIPGLGPGGTEFILGVAFSPDGHTLASGSGSGIRLWDIESGQQRLQINSVLHADPSPELAFSADGKVLFRVDPALSVLNRWNVSSGKGISEECFLPTNGRSASSFSRDRRALAWVRPSLTDSPVCLRDISTGKELMNIEVPHANSMALSPDGTFIATGGTDGALALRHVPSGMLRRIFLEAVHPVFAQFFSTDGERLGSLSTDGMVHDWDITSRKELRRARLPMGADESLYFASGDSRVLATLDKQKTLRFWSVTAGQKLGQIKAGWLSGTQPDWMYKSDMTFSADNRLAAALTEPNKVGVWEVATGKELLQIAGSSRSLAFAPGNTLLLTAGSAPDDGLATIRVWDIVRGKESRKFPLPRPPLLQNSQGVRPSESAILQLAVSSDGKTLAAVQSVLVRPARSRMAPQLFLSLHVWDLENAKELLALDLHRTRPGASRPSPVVLAFSPEGKYLVCGYRLLARQSDGGFAQYTIPMEEIATCASFSPDSKSLAVGSGDGTIDIHKVDSLLRQTNDLRQE